MKRGYVIKKEVHGKRGVTIQTLNPDMHEFYTATTVKTLFETVEDARLFWSGCYSLQVKNNGHRVFVEGPRGGRYSIWKYK